ncbi:MAG: hypothetical protein OXN44_06120, partial [Acidimicrobiaceae bacterium]|nr:hypothetical protein [Acidimicrobiaceae bacterium]MDE0605634.1 hypothetical protein [Acidimicrobiaceae bacterium]
TGPTQRQVDGHLFARALRDYGGWGLKGTKRDRLIGGGGTTALRITYTHESGEERKLTFLTDRADEAQQRIAQEQSR